MFDDVQQKSLQAVLLDLDLPDDDKKQIAEAVMAIATTFKHREISPLASLVGLAYASGVFLSMLAASRRAPVAVALNKVRDHAASHAEHIDSMLTANEARTLTEDIDDDVSSEVVANRLMTWFEAVGINPGLAVDAMIRLIGVTCKVMPTEQRVETIANLSQLLRLHSNIVQHIN